MVLPVVKGPEISMCSMSAFHSGQRATSDQRRQIASGDAVYTGSISRQMESVLRGFRPRA
jgi:hypothetical protein